MCAISIFLTPLFECFCCEDVVVSSTCCNNQNSANETCDVHPCLDAIDELGVVEILDSINLLGSKYSKNFNFVLDLKQTDFPGSFCSQTFSSKTKHHLIIGVIIV